MTPEDFDFLARLARDRIGLALGAGKEYRVGSHLANIARDLDLGSVATVVARLRAGGDEALVTAFIDALVNNETFFFRDEGQFDRLADTIVPALAATRGPGPIRIWCAACSTGQEPYSLAMLAQDLAGRLPEVSFDILASDISETCLGKARAGLYSPFEVRRGLTAERLNRHFAREGAGWRIAPRIRAAVRWRRFNLLEDPRALGRFDIVYCRNVLMYFDIDTRRRVLDQLASVLPHDGYLVLGATEIVRGLTDAFEPAPALPGINARIAASSPGGASASVKFTNAAPVVRISSREGVKPGR